MKFIVKCADNHNHVKCSCIRCDCLDKVTVEILRDHLIINGIDQSYTRRIWHGESAKRDRSIISNNRRCDDSEEVDSSEGDQLEDIYDVEENFTDHPYLFESLKNDSEKSLYDGCTTFTKLSALLRLYNLKTENEWIRVLRPSLNS